MSSERLSNQFFFSTLQNVIYLLGSQVLQNGQEVDVYSFIIVDQVKLLPLPGLQWGIPKNTDTSMHVFVVFAIHCVAFQLLWINSHENTPGMLFKVKLKYMCVGLEISEYGCTLVFLSVCIF